LLFGVGKRRQATSVDGELEGHSPEQILAWAAERYAPRIALATAFGPESCVLIDLIARGRLPVSIFTLDTGLLFPETYALWHRLEQRYGVRIRGVRPEQSVEQQALAHGEQLWQREPGRCCELRKLEPLRGALSGLDAWVTGIRREQTPARAAALAAEPDARFGLVKVNPLVAWSESDVWEYVRSHDVPVNELHARGYRSIGCLPCTTPVAAGEPARAGRWRGQARQECGLHIREEKRHVSAG
jgi:phosphoadenylyl-sulfate reductase (thioredoxin)